jgi:hypothetical protein
MPDGVVVWFDPKSGDARIVRGSHVYPVTAAEIDPRARRAGARVHFDIRRDGGVDRAGDVRLRAGRRNDAHHHRAGTLVGARRADTKGPSPVEAFHTQAGLSLAVHPLAVADAWGNAVAAGDVDYALAFYAPDAVVHTAAGDVSGRGDLQRLLSELPVRGERGAPSVGGEGDAAVVRWEPAGDADTGLTARLRVAHGEIVEQWFGDVEPVPRHRVGTTPRGEVPIVITADEDIPDYVISDATRTVMALTDLFDGPLLLVRLKLSFARDKARPRRALVQGTLDVNGHLVRAHVAAETFQDALDVLAGRLRDKLEHLAQHQEALRRRVEPPPPGEWRHGDVAPARPPYFDRPVEERELVRHKAYVADELRLDEAVFDMEQLDYDFHLFRDIDTGEDSLIARDDDGYRVQHLNTPPGHTGPHQAGGTAIDEDAAPAPVLDIAEAIERLDAGGERFVFFADRTSGRGAVVYHRYDGHYGLLTLAEAG